MAHLADLGSLCEVALLVWNSLLALGPKVTGAAFCPTCCLVLALSNAYSAHAAAGDLICHSIPHAADWELKGTSKYSRTGRLVL